MLWEWFIPWVHLSVGFSLIRQYLLGLHFRVALGFCDVLYELVENHVDSLNSLKLTLSYRDIEFWLSVFYALLSSYS